MEFGYVQGNGLVRLGMHVAELSSWQELQRLAEFSLRTRLILQLGEYISNGRDRARILGFVGESLPLNRIRRVDLFLPFADLKAEWVPFAAPSSPDWEAIGKEYQEKIDSEIAQRGLVPMETIRADWEAKMRPLFR